MLFKKIALTLVFLLSSVHAFASEQETDANRFWQSFRRALLQQKEEQVALMTKFPLEVRGTDDSDPVRHYGKKQLKSVLKKLLSEPQSTVVEGRFITKSTVVLVAEKEELVGDDFLTTGLIRVHDFEFQRLDGRWYFVRCYLDE